MKLIIAGSRDLNLTPHYISDKMAEFGIYDQITEVVSGGASGVDKSGEKWVENEFWGDVEMQNRCDPNHQIRDIKIKIFEAEWNFYGNAAGPIRNKKMAEYADCLLLIHKNTPGSLSMKKYMKELGKPIFEVIYE